MKILHVNAGNEYGGGLFHILALFEAMNDPEMALLVFEEGPVAKMARERGIAVYLLEQRSRYDTSVVKKLAHFIEKERFEVVHTHGPRANTLMARAQKRLQRVKWVVTVHSNPLLDFKGRGFKGKLFERTNLWAMKKADCVIAVSREIRDIVIRKGTSQIKVHVIHNGVKFNQSIKPSYKRQESFTICAAGRLEWVKGYDYLLEALKQAELSNWKLVLNGTGSKEDELKKQAKDLNIDTHIQFNGWVNKREIEQVMQSSDIMVVPSLSESFPLVALEAGQHGLPVIATDVGDVGDVIVKRELGWLIPSKDTSALTEALKEAYDLWEKYQLVEIGKNYHEWVKQFSTEKQAQETKEQYYQLVKDSN
jgi:hypothetical protein